MPPLLGTLLSDYSDLFGARQKLHLGLLAREIEKLDCAIGEAMKVAFSDHLITNNMLCAYAGGWRRLTGLFTIRAYRHIARPVELNPWLEKNGRGTFPNAVRAVQRAVKGMRDSVEPTIAGESISVPSNKPGKWDVRCRDARDLTYIDSGSVDLVLTDPPYFNYIAYSELGHFFVPWMVRFGMIGIDHLKKFPEGQIAQSGTGANAAKTFSNSLYEAFQEMRRVCKPNARMVFTYQNLDGHGWQSLASALAKAGIIPFRIWPMYGDSCGGFHKHPNSISWDCVAIFRIRESRKINSIFDHLEFGKIEAEKWSDRLRRTSHELGPGDVRNLAHAAAMVGAFSAASGQKATGWGN